MKLFFISQEVVHGYDTYSDAVVCAIDEVDASLISPDGGSEIASAKEYGSWCNPEDVKVEYIGKAKKGMKRGLVCSSFHAG